MTCFHPMIRIEHHNRPYKTADGRLAYKATIEQADDVLNRLEELRSYPNTKAEVIPCGKCIGCRLEYSREWANRGYLESKLYKENWFITLTYDDEHIKILEEKTSKNGITYTNNEWNGTLIPEDFTGFMHDFRQIMQRDYGITGIRFMACGEYGEEGARPHYHAILLNCHIPVETFYKPKIKNKHTYWQNTILERAWKKGISNIGEASWNNIAYTARYITKKINGNMSDEYYTSLGQEKEFFRVSRMPGIGKPYYDKYKEEIYKNDEIIIKNQEGTISCKPPKYFDELYKKDNPKHFKEIERRRMKQKRNLDRVQDQRTSLSRLEQLAVKERSKEERTQALIRTYESKGA